MQIDDEIFLTITIHNIYKNTLYDNKCIVCFSDMMRDMFIMMTDTLKVICIIYVFNYT